MSFIRSYDRYIHKVFDFSALLEGLEDRRQNPDISMDVIVKAILYGTVFRIAAMEELERECKEGILRHRVGPVSDDTFGYGLDHLDVSSLQAGWAHMAKIMKRNGMIRKSPFADWTVGVLDGIEVLSSYSRCCDRCLKREITVSGETRIQYYHRVVVCCLVGHAFRIPLGLELVRPGEGEVDCALRLLDRLVADLGRRYLDAVVGDALYCTPAFFSGCRELGLHPVAVLKENQKELLREAAWQREDSKPVRVEETKKEKLQVWDLPDVDWATVGHDVRVIWAEREVWVVKEEGKTRAGHWESRRRVFVFSKTMDHLAEEEAYAVGCHRWDVDASLFQDMTKNFHFKHATLHFTYAYENLLMLRLIAYCLFMWFFHRHIDSRRKKKILSATVMSTLLYQSAVIHLAPD